MQEVLSRLRNEELQIDREETVDLLCRRHGLARDVAERIVMAARNVDHAHAVAELMR